ncbi:MAG: energy transducer TonB [Candidatus Methylomirabilis oxyfera]|nr:energy transducer TonB [Candidatus Methylomirabilis oxyfera]
MTLLVGSQTGPRPLGRFLLSSTGFHLIFAWILVSVGLPTVPSAPKPLVVTIIGSEHAESSASSGQLDRTHTRQPSITGPATSSVNSKAMARSQVSPPSPARVSSSPARTAEAVDSTALDERIAEPKTVGVPASGSQAAGVAFAAGGLPSGPVLLSSDGDGEEISDPAGRGGAGRLDAALAAPSTPSVTIGSAQGAGGWGAGWSGNGGAGGRSSAPNYGINPLPKYPLLAREKGYEGTVYLRVLVRADGRVERLTVDRSSGHEILDRSAVDSVKEWAFFPAKKGGKSVQSWVLLPVKFALN